MKMKQIDKQINDIATDKNKGAIELAGQALEVVRSAVTFSRATDTDSFLAEIKDVINKLAICRPAMAVISNKVLRFDKWLQDFPIKNIDLEVLRSECLKTVDKLKEELIENKKKSIEHAAGIIDKTSVIVICSYSSTINAVLAKAVKQGKKLVLHIIKSSSGGISYGEISKKALESYGVECELFDDDMIAAALIGADMVVLGSDTVFTDGSVLNGYPSLLLATLAQETVPVYVVSDTSKINLDNKKYGSEQGFELIPFEFLTGLITEHGIFKGDDIIAYLKSLDD